MAEMPVVCMITLSGAFGAFYWATLLGIKLWCVLRVGTHEREAGERWGDSWGELMTALFSHQWCVLRVGTIERERQESAGLAL